MATAKGGHGATTTPTLVATAPAVNSRRPSDRVCELVRGADVWAGAEPFEADASEHDARDVRGLATFQRT